MYDQIVIVGAGQAAVQAIDTLRRKGFTGKTGCGQGDEPWLPYQRPPLSKKYLAGALERDRLMIRPAQFYSEHSVEVHIGRRVEDITRSEQRLRLDDGSTLAYDALLLATGSKPRKLTAPGADFGGVHYLRTIADVERIRTDFGPGKRLVIIGGGYIGLEVAATARELGLDVTVLEMADRVMNRVTCAEISSFYEKEHTRHGVRIICNARVHAHFPVTHSHVACARCSPRMAPNIQPTWSLLVSVCSLPTSWHVDHRRHRSARTASTSTTTAAPQTRAFTPPATAAITPEPALRPLPAAGVGRTTPLSRPRPRPSTCWAWT